MTLTVIQMVLEHANFLIMRFEEIRILTGMDFYAYYLTASFAVALPPMIDFLSSTALQVEVAQSIANGALDLANVASQSASLAGNLDPQSVSNVANAAINSLASQSASLASSLDPQSVSNVANAAVNSLESTTEVFLSDADLVEAISPIMENSINDYPNTRLISSNLLQTLGLYTNSVIAYLMSLGFKIL